MCARRGMTLSAPMEIKVNYRNIFGACKLNFSVEYSAYVCKQCYKYAHASKQSKEELKD